MAGRESERITKKYLLNFSSQVSEKPLVYHLVKDFDLIINIFRAKITDQEEGFMVLEISGLPEQLEQGVEYIKLQNVVVDEAEKGVRWNEEQCTQCGNCLSHCPTGALHITVPTSRRITFESSKCIECLACIRNCPYGACFSVF
jgi:L-aspartate semialdehyde sulfurtransferase ferredoxin